MRWDRRSSATGTTSATLKLRKTWRFSIMPSGCARLVRAPSAVMCKTASGLPETINRLLPGMSILRTLSRSYTQTAYLSGKCIHVRQPLKFGGRSRFGKNASANEKNPGHAFPAQRYNRGAVLGLSRSRPARTDGGGNPRRTISLGCHGHTGIPCCGSCCRLSLACSAEGPKDSSHSSAALRIVFNWDVLKPVSPRGYRRRHHQKLLPAQGNAGSESRRIARGSVRPIYRPGCAGCHHRHAHRVAL